MCAGPPRPVAEGLGLCRRALGSNMITGSLPSSLSALTLLNELCAHEPFVARLRGAADGLGLCRRDLGSNKMTGSLPSSLSALTLLNRLCAQEPSACAGRLGGPRTG
jgi:hypothetical protein